MEGEKPRNWLEVRILNRLNDRGRPSLLQELRDMVPEHSDTVISFVFSLEREGLVWIKELQPGHLVGITEGGRTLILKLMESPESSEGPA